MTITIRDAAEEDIPAIFEVRASVRENHLSVEQMARCCFLAHDRVGLECDLV